MARPSPDDKESPPWALGFELPIDSNEERRRKKEKEEEEEEKGKRKEMEQEKEKGREEEEKAGSEASKPQKKADTIRGTPIVKQPGPNLAEKTKKEMTDEFFGGMEDAENAMARDLEERKYNQEQIDEIRNLMAKSIKKMNITMEGKEEEGEEEGATGDQLELQVLGLQRKLDEKGLQDDQTTAQMIALEDQVKQAEIARAAERAEKEALRVESQKQYHEAMAKVDAATKELREKKAKGEHEKEAEIRKEVTQKYEKDIRDKDDKIGFLQRELKDKLDKLNRAEAEKKDGKQKAKSEDEWKQINKEIQDCQRAGREKDRQIKELTTSLEDTQHKLDLEKARYHDDETVKDEIKSLKEQVQRLNEELLAVEEQNRQLMNDLEGIEKTLESANKHEELIAELSLKLRTYENEDKAYLVRIGNLEQECKQLALQLVRHKREIKAKNKIIEENAEALIEARERISQLETMVGVDILEIKEENKKLLEENRQLQEKLKELENQPAGDKTARFRKQPSASEAELFASKQDIKRLEDQLEIVRQLKLDEEEKARRERRRLEQRIEEALSEVHRLEQMEKPDLEPDQAELADLRWQVQNCDSEKARLRERIRHLEKEVEEAHKLINKITVEHQELLSANKSLEKKPSESVKSVKELQRSSKKKKEKEKEQALEEENEKLQEKDDESKSGVEGNLWELIALKAHSSLCFVEILLGFLVLRRALNGMVSGDMDDVKAAMAIVSDDSEGAGNAELVAEVAWMKAIVCYYEGDTPEALIGFTQALEAEVWEDHEKVTLEEWIHECTPGTGSDCPTEKSGYREALGFGPVPGTLKAPLKRPSDKQLKEAKKLKKEAEKAAKKAKKAKKPRRAPAPRRRGVHRRDLYVGILSPRQQKIWDTIDFNNFDYNKLTSEQQSLFSFEPFEDEPHSPVGGAPPPQPPQPPPESPPESPRRYERVRTSSSIASSAASIVAEGNQIRRPSRMDDLTTNASLHIQWLTARLADREARIRELENIHGDILIVRARLHRREGQIQELRKHANVMIAELTVWRRTAREERRRWREERNRGWWAWIPV